METEWWEYRCEYPLCEYPGAWAFFKKCEEEEKPEDSVCECGEEVVVASKRKSGPFVQVSIIPAAFEDEFRGLSHEKEFHVELKSLVDDWRATTVRFYKKEEALKIAALFIGEHLDTVKKVWRMKMLGQEGERIMAVIENEILGPEKRKRLKLLRERHNFKTKLNAIEKHLESIDGVTPLGLASDDFKPAFDLREFWREIIKFDGTPTSRSMHDSEELERKEWLDQIMQPFVSTEVCYFNYSGYQINKWFKVRINGTEGLYALWNSIRNKEFVLLAENGKSIIGIIEEEHWYEGHFKTVE